MTYPGPEAPPRRDPLLDWLTHPATDADRIRLARLLASGRRDAVTAALRRLAEHRAAGEHLASWQSAAVALLAFADRPVLRSACLSEAARLAAQAGARRERAADPHRHRHRRAGAGVRRYGPPPRLAGCHGKVVRWRAVPAGS